MEVGCCIVRVASYGELVRAASLIDLGTRKQNVAPVQMCSCAAWVHLNGSIVTCHCVSAPSLFLQCISFIDHRDGGTHRCDSPTVGNLCGRYGGRLGISHPLYLLIKALRAASLMRTQ